MKKRTSQILALGTCLMLLSTACSSNAPISQPSTPATQSQASATSPEAVPLKKDLKANEYPPGKLIIWTYGMPEYMRQYFQNYIDRDDTAVKDVEVEMVNYSGESEVRQQIIMTVTSGAMEDLPSAISTFPVSMQVMVDNGILKDLTQQVQPYLPQFINGAFDQASYNNKIYGIPYALQPKMLFYNQDIFERYSIDPSRMSTFDGYLEVGSELLEKSAGKTKLSYVDPGSTTWRYWFRRGLMPQADAKIWDDNGNVAFDKDPGTRLAMETFAKLFEGNMLYKAETFKPAFYEAARNEEVATFYIESFLDSFLRSNLGDMSEKWRSMPAPVFEQVGTAGAQAIGMYCVVEKPNDPYGQLFVDMMIDFNTNIQVRNQWSDQMIASDMPTEHPITKDLLADPYWATPSDFYGGESYKKMVTKAYENQSDNLRVTQNDAEADVIISGEIEKYVAGSQNIEDTIKNIGSQLRGKLNLK